MSRRNSFEDLQRQLADLQVIKDFTIQGKQKKVPPAVPPKKKPQPQYAQVSIIKDQSESVFPRTSNLSYDNDALNSVAKSDNENKNKVYSNIMSRNSSRPSTSGYSESIALVPREEEKTTNKSSFINKRLYSQNDEILPPVPPPPPMYTLDKYSNTLSNDQYLPPPSPVSSNYSELMRATTNMRDSKSNYAPVYQNEFSNYGDGQITAYESLYESINIQPPVNFEPENNNLYKEYENKATSPSEPLEKEAEVDALTDLLVKSITDSQDLDFFGICVKCNEKVVGENSGCTAMENTYHIKCFCCCRCNTNLHGKSFYAVEGLPYCEVDYYETLEKCHVCNKPIFDRILRATGNPYHKDCFTCVVCNKSLDGVPFTVDAMNKIHCIDDFHKKFAPRCCVCDLPIMPEEGEEETVRVVALDRSFHVRCYRCEDCGLLLSSESEGRGCYPLDNHILCKTCNAHRIRMLTNVMTTDL